MNKAIGVRTPASPAYGRRAGAHARGRDSDVAASAARWPPAGPHRGAVGGLVWGLLRLAAL